MNVVAYRNLGNPQLAWAFSHNFFDAEAAEIFAETLRKCGGREVKLLTEKTEKPTVKVGQKFYTAEDVENALNARDDQIAWYRQKLRDLELLAHSSLKGPAP